MTNTVRDLNTWQRNERNEPIFTCIDDAKYYAHLISGNKRECLKISRLRQEAINNIRLMRATSGFDEQGVIDLTAQFEFLAEVVKELSRIGKEGPKT